MVENHTHVFSENTDSNDRGLSSEQDVAKEPGMRMRQVAKEPTVEPRARRIRQRSRTPPQVPSRPSVENPPASADCHNCGHSNLSTARFCNQCGTALEAVFVEVALEADEEDVMIGRALSAEGEEIQIEQVLQRLRGRMWMSAHVKEEFDEIEIPCAHVRYTQASCKVLQGLPGNPRENSSRVRVLGIRWKCVTNPGKFIKHFHLNTDI